LFQSYLILTKVKRQIMDKREAERKARHYISAVRDVVKFDKAVLFGSYADGAGGIQRY
jgi:hypothetical protein